MNILHEENANISIENMLFENMRELRYLGKTLTCQKYRLVQVTSRLNEGKASFGPGHNGATACCQRIQILQSTEVHLCISYCVDV